MRIVVVEDNVSVAAMIIEALEAARHRVVGHARTVDQGTKLLAEVQCDAAILDIDLLGVNSRSVALALKARKIPFVVISGSERLLTPAHRGASLVVKPFRVEALLAAVEKLRRPIG
jgi:DNA-binding response OmpR family regulator